MEQGGRGRESNPRLRAWGPARYQFLHAAWLPAAARAPASAPAAGGRSRRGRASPRERRGSRQDAKSQNSRGLLFPVVAETIGGSGETVTRQGRGACSCHVQSLVSDSATAEKGGKPRITLIPRIRGYPLLDMLRYQKFEEGPALDDGVRIGEEPEAVCVSRQVFALPERENGHGLPGGVLLYRGQRYARGSLARAQDDGAAASRFVERTADFTAL